MLPIFKTLERRLRRDPRPVEAGKAADMAARAVRIGLLIYLTPVVVLVVGIATASIAVQAAARVLDRSGSGTGRQSLRLALGTVENEKSPEARRRRLRAIH